MTKKLTTADLMRELDALKKEVADLKARPAQRVEHHYHYSHPQWTQPYRPLQPYTPWWGTVTSPGIAWNQAVPCSTSTITANYTPNSGITYATSGYLQTTASAQAVAE